jgi:hypothetical protein
MSLPAWQEKVTIGQCSMDEDEHSLSDPDGRVRDTLAVSDWDWTLVYHDGYLSACGAGDTTASPCPGLADQRTHAGVDYVGPEAGWPMIEKNG